MHDSRTHLLFPGFLALVCACTPPSKDIGDTLTTGGGSSGTTGAQTGSTTGDPTDGPTDPSSGTTTLGTTDDLATSTTGTSTDGDTTTGVMSTGQTSSDATSTGDLSAGTDGAAFNCGELTCDVATQYCSVFVPGLRGAEITHDCAQIPARCDDVPACACLPNAEQPPCQCAEDVGFTVTCYGA